MFEWIRARLHDVPAPRTAARSAQPSRRGPPVLQGNGKADCASCYNREHRPLESATPRPTRAFTELCLGEGAKLTSRACSYRLCRRCGRRAFHKQHKSCASCGFPAAKIRSCALAASAVTSADLPLTPILQTSGDRRPSDERPLEPDAWRTSRTSRAGSRTGALLYFSMLATTNAPTFRTVC